MDNEMMNLIKHLVTLGLCFLCLGLLFSLFSKRHLMTIWPNYSSNWPTLVPTPKRSTGCMKKKVIAIVSELLCVWTRFFHIRKDHAFSCWMISSSYQMDKKWANTNPIKNVSQNRIFSPLRVGLKPLKINPLWCLSWWISLQ
jgi:hypothetical protein